MGALPNVIQYYLKKLVLKILIYVYKMFIQYCSLFTGG